MDTLKLSLELLAISLVGFIVRKTGLVDSGFSKQLSNVQVNVVAPCLILHSLAGMDLGAGLFARCIHTWFAAFGTIAVLMVLGQLGFLTAGKGYLGRALRFGTIFTNFTLFGLPVVEATYGAEGLFYFIVFTLPMRFLYYSLPPVILRPPEGISAGEGRKALWKIVCTPAVVCSFLGLALCFLNIHFPPLLDKILEDVADCCFANGMMIVGMIAAEYELKKIFSLRFLPMPIFRNIVSPALAIGILYFLPIDVMLKKLIIIYCSIPCGVLLTSYSVKYEPDPQAHIAAAGGVLISILLAIVTMPFWISIADALIL